MAYKNKIITLRSTSIFFFLRHWVRLVMNHQPCAEISSNSAGPEQIVHIKPNENGKEFENFKWHRCCTIVSRPKRDSKSIRWKFRVLRLFINQITKKKKHRSKTKNTIAIECGFKHLTLNYDIDTVWNFTYTYTLARRIFNFFYYKKYIRVVISTATSIVLVVYNMCARQIANMKPNVHFTDSFVYSKQFLKRSCTPTDRSLSRMQNNYYCAKKCCENYTLNCQR